MSEEQKKLEKQKKKKSILPYRIVQNESVELVASPIGPIELSPLSQVDKTILLDRLLKEIVRTFNFCLSPILHKPSKRARDGESICVQRSAHTQERAFLISLLRSRFTMGINSCTRALEKLSPPPIAKQSSLIAVEKDEIIPKPSLVILARDIRPPTMIAHIPYYCHLFKIPILLLPGRASVEMGKVLGGKRSSVIMFFQRLDRKHEDEQSSRYHDIVDSFIEFAKSMQPTFE